MRMPTNLDEFLTEAQEESRRSMHMLAGVILIAFFAAVAMFLWWIV